MVYSEYLHVPEKVRTKNQWRVTVVTPSLVVSVSTFVCIFVTFFFFYTSLYSAALVYAHPLTVNKILLNYNELIYETLAVLKITFLE